MHFRQCTDANSLFSSQKMAFLCVHALPLCQRSAHKLLSSTNRILKVPFYMPLLHTDFIDCVAPAILAAATPSVQQLAFTVHKSFTHKKDRSLFVG